MRRLPGGAHAQLQQRGRRPLARPAGDAARAGHRHRFEKAQAAATKGGRLLQRAGGYYTLYAGKGGGHAAAGGEGGAAPAGETDGLAPGQVHVQEYDEESEDQDASADGEGGGGGAEEAEDARLLGNGARSEALAL